MSAALDALRAAYEAYNEREAERTAELEELFEAAERNPNLYYRADERAADVNEMRADEQGALLHLIGAFLEETDRDA